jgi:hypothetical protein
MAYLPTATNFTDMEVRQPPTGYPCNADDAVLCPVCKGYGGWVLTENAYPLPKGHEDTAENRAKYRHFRAHCGQCTGWGWVPRGSADAQCVHEYKELSQETARAKGVEHFGMCWHVYECAKCGHHKSTDSND